MSPKSFWHLGLDELEFSSDSFPTHADIVIVGGGLSGVSLLFWLSEFYKDSETSILLLEKKYLSAGATGRNGGHLRPVNEGETECAKELIETLIKYKLEEEVELFLHSNTPLAAQIHSSKLVLSLARLCIKKRNNNRIITHTEVQRFEKTDQNKNILYTQRGNIICSYISFCTNAYTPNILPQLKNLIIPTRGQCIVTQPLSQDIPFIFHTNSNYTAPDSSSLYIIQRKNDRRVIAGGFRSSVLGGESNIENDDEINLEISSKLATWLQTDERIITSSISLKVDGEWSGIMGFTFNGKPFVGELSNGIYVTAGFNGHGMPVCFWTSKAIACMITKQSLPNSLCNFMSQVAPNKSFSLQNKL